MRYRFVAIERASFPVRMLCRLVGAAVSGFYAWLRRGPARHHEDDRRMSERIGAIWICCINLLGPQHMVLRLLAQIPHVAVLSANATDPLKAVRYTSEGQTLVQATRMAPELTEIFKKLDIPVPKTILAVG